MAAAPKPLPFLCRSASCSRRPAAIARASTVPCRQSSRRWTSTAPRLRAQGDRPQQARRQGAGQAWGDLRRPGDRGARGRGRRLLRPRGRAERAGEREGARAAHDRRHLPAGDQGPRRGAQVRRGGLHDHPRRPRGPRGGRGDDRRGAGQHRSRPVRRRGRRRSSSTTPTTSRSSPRRPCRSTRPPASSPGSARGSPRSSGRSPTTSVTRPRTARSRSSSWRAIATWCS